MKFLFLSGSGYWWTFESIGRNGEGTRSEEWEDAPKHFARGGEAEWEDAGRVWDLFCGLALMHKHMNQGAHI